MWRAKRICVTSQLLSKPKFSSLEKIKTIGSTYMVASGLLKTPNSKYLKKHNLKVGHHVHVHVRLCIQYQDDAKRYEHSAIESMSIHRNHLQQFQFHFWVNVLCACAADDAGGPVCRHRRRLRASHV